MLTLSQDLIFSISIVFISFIVGMVMTALVRKTNFYSDKLSNLNFINSKFTNKVIGVGVVKWIVKNTFFRYLNPDLKFGKRMSISDVRSIRDKMTKSEIDHLFAFTFVTIFVIRAFIDQNYSLAFIILLVNILMNLNPSLLQQQNKRRIDKLLYRVEKG